MAFPSGLKTRRVHDYGHIFLGHNTKFSLLISIRRLEVTLVRRNPAKRLLSREMSRILAMKTPKNKE